MEEVRISYPLNRSPHEFLGLIHSVRLSVFLPKANVFPLLDELSPEVIPYFIKERSRDSLVGTEVGYGLDSQVSITSRGKIFLIFAMSKQVLKPTPRPIQWAARAYSSSLPPSSAEVKSGAVPPLTYVFMA
jgi:hypothetical protein